MNNNSFLLNVAKPIFQFPALSNTNYGFSFYGNIKVLNSVANLCSSLFFNYTCTVNYRRSILDYTITATSTTGAVVDGTITPSLTCALVGSDIVFSFLINSNLSSPNSITLQWLVYNFSNSSIVILI